CTMNERVTSSARWRCSKSGVIAPSLLIFAAVFDFRQHVQFFVDATQRLEVAQAAGGESILRVNTRLACSERGAEGLDLFAPEGEQSLPVAPLLYARDGAVIARVAHVFHFAGPQLGEGYGGDVLLRADRVERKLRLVGARRVPPFRRHD